MKRKEIRKLISNKIWEDLQLAINEAKHSAAGAPSKLSDRDFLEAILYLGAVVAKC